MQLNQTMIVNCGALRLSCTDDFLSYHILATRFKSINKCMTTIFAVHFLHNPKTLLFFWRALVLANQNAANFRTTSAHCARDGGAYSQNSFE